jgi:outer membrane protein W
MKKMVVIILAVVYFAGFASGEEKKWQLSFLAGIQRVSAFGSESDYVAGENDFPVTPSHSSLGGGVSLGYLFNKRLSLEFGTRYYTRSTATLLDPSDQDTVEIKTAEHLSLSANFMLWAGQGKVRSYLTVGAGIDNIFAEDKTYTTNYGYEIEFLAPDRKVDFSFNLGVGFQSYLAANFGIAVTARYVVIYSSPSHVKSMDLMAGVFFNFR